MGCVAAFMAFSMGILPNIVRPWFGKKFALAYHPITSFFFLAMLTRLVLARELNESSLEFKKSGLLRDKTR